MHYPKVMSLKSAPVSGHDARLFATSEIFVVNGESLMKGGQVMSKHDVLIQKLEEASIERVNLRSNVSDLIDKLAQVSMERLDLRNKVSELIKQWYELHDEFERVHEHFQAAQDEIDFLTQQNALSMRMIRELLDLIDTLKETK